MKPYGFLLDLIRESEERKRRLRDAEADRCQQLAALEAEIGRAVIDAGVIFNAINPAIDELIARWRKLHAEGAEAEAATERQEKGLHCEK